MKCVIDNTPPVIRSSGGVVPTLRDQFAMVALTGLLPLWASVEGEAEELRLDVVTEAYAIADAMLIVRAR